MAVAIIMPRQGQSVESCIITEWKKQEGDPVKEGDILFSYETDKASFEEEAKASGTLLKILAQEGDDVPVLENVAVIGDPGEDISEFLATAPENAPAEAAPAAESAPAAEPVKPEAPAATGTVQSGERLKISPRARMFAEEQGVDPSRAVPTGPKGRIIERDVRALAAAGPQPAESRVPQGALDAPPAEAAEFEDVKLSHVRKVIGSNMLKSLQTMAQLTNTASFDATQILAYRHEVKAHGEGLGLGNITLNDIVLYAVSRVLPEHPDLNAHYLDDRMRLFQHVNLGMAVDTPRGLLVPTIFAADTLSLEEISAQAKELAAKAREGTISPDLLQGGTFTITNLGSFGIESFTPVINPPQTGILGVNSLETRVRDVDGTAVPYQAMALSLTFDHRAVDGAPAARFLQALCRALTHFPLLLAR
ncbi:MAG: 2-oxo acid dehydrogenase subunit E2 [Clostridia bacterium]|nr:2-oxo acid dehydrogenase subunit E2 [Clostridia bacterium]